jgi:DNA primase
LDNAINSDKKFHTKQSAAEEGIIAYLLQNPEKADYVNNKVSADNFVTDQNKKVYSILCSKMISSTYFTYSLLSNELNEDEMGIITGIEAKFKEILLSEEVLDEYINSLIESENSIRTKSEISSNEDLLKLSQILKNKKN